MLFRSQSPAATVIWTVILVTSLIAIYGLSRAGTLIFWKCYEMQGPGAPEAPAAAPRPGPIPPKVEPDEPIQDLRDASATWLAMLATGLLIAGIVALSVFAQPAMRLALAEAFGCGVNDLPLSMVLSWYEQKAVCILLTLLHLGIKNIRLGPTLPAFVSPNVLNYLVENFGIAPITTPEEDLKVLLKR